MNFLNSCGTVQLTPKSSPRYTETDPDDVSKLQSLLLKQMKKEEAFKVTKNCSNFNTLDRYTVALIENFSYIRKK